MPQVQNAPSSQSPKSPKCPKVQNPQNAQKSKIPKMPKMAKVQNAQIAEKVQNPQNAQNGSIFEKKKFLEKNLYDSLSIGVWLLKCTFITLQWFCVYFWCKRYSCMTETRVSWYTKVETFGKVYLVNL